jgi:hypothetical protein
LRPANSSSFFPAGSAASKSRQPDIGHGTRGEGSAALEHTDKAPKVRLVKLQHALESQSCEWGRSASSISQGKTSDPPEVMMGPNPEVWPMLLLSVGVAVVAAWVGDLVGTVAILAGIAGAILLG